MARYWLGKTTPSYGDEPDKGPIHALAVAVVERTLLDAAGGVSVPGSKEVEARKQIEEPPNDTEFTFFWWLSIAYPNPERIRKLFLKALHERLLAGVKYRSRRRVEIKNGACVHKTEAYNAN